MMFDADFFDIVGNAFLEDLLHTMDMSSLFDPLWVLDQPGLALVAFWF